jgi:mannitol-specific phosphotransferase system IIBC component
MFPKGRYEMEKVEVKFGEWIENGFNLYKNNFGILVLASLVAVVLSAVTVGPK